VNAAESRLLVNTRPFESSRFIQTNGSLSVTFTPASGTIGATIRCYRLPKI
jgi:hypothetical protein